MATLKIPASRPWAKDVDSTMERVPELARLLLNYIDGYPEDTEFHEYLVEAADALRLLAEECASLTVSLENSGPTTVW